MGNTDDSEFQSEKSRLERIVRFLDRALFWVFVGPPGGILTDLAWLVMIVLIISSKLRSYSGWIFDAITIIVMIAICFAWGVFLAKFIIPLLNGWALGKPVFGKMGGLDRRTFFTMLKCVKAIEFKFKDDDNEIVRDFSGLDRYVTEETFKRKYRENIYDLMPLEERGDFEKLWAAKWEEMLRVGTEDITFGEALSDENIESRIIPQKLAATPLIIGPLVKFFQLVMVYLLIRFLDGKTELLTLVQVGLTLSFVLSIAWFINHSLHWTEIPLSGIIGQVPADIKELWAEKFKNFKRHSIRPISLKVNRRYYSLIRDYFSPFILCGTIVNTLLALILVGIALLIGLIGQQANIGEMVLWYQHFLIGLLIIPLGLLFGYYITFWILQNIRKILAPVVSGLVGAALPFALDYLFTGKLDFVDLKNVMVASVAGLTTLISTAISSQVRKTWEEE